MITSPIVRRSIIRSSALIVSLAALLGGCAVGAEGTDDPTGNAGAAGAGAGSGGSAGRASDPSDPSRPTTDPSDPNAPIDPNELGEGENDSSDGGTPTNPDSGTQEPTCTPDVYARAIGTVPDTCSANEVKQAGLCYEQCQAGWSNEAFVCWKPCAAGFTDTGFFCHRDAEIIPIDSSNCPFYDACGLTFAKGCASCPSGFANDGCLCRKDAYIYAQESYTIPAGTIPGCAADEEEDAGLCYAKCKDGYKGVGPTCVKTCP